jgi:hypothetical protein
MVLAKMSVEHNISDWIPAKNIVEIWINQARNIYDKGALLFPGLGGEAGGGGPK